MAISKKTVRDLDLRGKSVIMRVDFNVPMKDGKVLDDTRIRAALPTIEYVLKQGARRLVLMSHLGDPKKDIEKAREKAEKDGKSFEEKKFSDGKHRMAPVAIHLAALLQRKIALAPACMGPDTEEMVRSLPEGGILMLENTRYHKEEKAKEPAEREKMARVLATYGDIFVNDAFGTAHRAHASTETIAKLIPGVAGLLMEKELEYLQEKVVKDPAKPFVAIIGGAKVSSKIGVLERLLEKVDCLVVGGGMAFTFFKAKGYEIGKSLCEDDQMDLAKAILGKSEGRNVRLILPVDQVVASEFSEKGQTEVVDADKMPSDMIGMDIGPKSIEAIRGALVGARTIFWNGPLGVFEMETFARGTMEVAKAIAGMKEAVTVIGGGDSVAAVNKAGLADSMSHISTGGGASLELVEGKTLPGVAALQDR